MRNSKKIILISIIILIVLILIAGGVFAYTYFFTDAFLSNQQRFMKYVSQSSTNMGYFFKEEELENYFVKKQNEAYSNNSELSLEMSTNEEEAQETLQMVNNLKITLTGNTDLQNNYIDQQIALKYSDTDLVSGELLFRQDYMGLKVNDVINKYIVLENNNLQQFAQNMGFTDITSIPNQINISELLQSADTISFTDDELTQIKDRYLNVVASNLTEDMFSNQDYENGQVYTLTINEEKGNQILSGLINELKNDDLIMNKIKQVYIESQDATEEEANQIVEQLKTTLDSVYLSSSESETGIMQENQTTETTQTEPQEIYIKVYVSDRNTEKIEFEVPQTSKIILISNANQINVEIQEFDSTVDSTYKTLGSFIINKTKENDNLSYDFSVVTEDNTKIFGFTMSYTGLSTMSNVQERYAFDPSGSINQINNNNGIIQTAGNVSERNNIESVLNDLKIRMLQDNYLDSTEFQINATTIQESLTEKGYNMTVSQNAEGTFSIISNDSGITYTVDASGNITNVQEPEETASEDNMTFIINYTTTANFGQITQKEIAENEREIINNWDAETVESTFNRIGEIMAQKIMEGLPTESFNSSGDILTNARDELESNSNNSSTLPDLSEQEMQAFNSRFSGYEGQSMTEAQVNALIQAVIAANQTSDRKVSITFPGTDGSEVTICDSSNTSNTSVNTGNTYTVTMEYEEGYINRIVVTQN